MAMEIHVLHELRPEGSYRMTTRLHGQGTRLEIDILSDAATNLDREELGSLINHLKDCLSQMPTEEGAEA